MTAVLITGGAGFIGSTLADRLVTRGIETTCLDSFDAYYDPGLKRSNLSGVLEAGGRLIEGDICDAPWLAATLEALRPAAVVHLAARAGVRPSLLHPELYVDTNVTGTLNVLRAALNAGVPQIVFASSSSVYGNVDDAANEVSSLCRPLSPYGATKVAGEALCSAYAGSFTSVTALRFFTVFGPRQRPDMAISKFVRQIDAGETLTLFGDGSSSRDYTFVEDIVDGIEAALDRCLPGYHAFNLGRGQPVVLSDLVRLIEQHLDKQADIRYERAAETDPAKTLADISLARSLLDYEPRVSIDEGIKRYLAWLNHRLLTHGLSRGK